MSAIICIELNYKDEALANQEFPDIEKEFCTKTKGFTQIAHPKIFQDKEKVIVEMDLQSRIIAFPMLAIIRQQVCKSYCAKLKAQGREITAKCYLKKEAKK